MIYEVKFPTSSVEKKFQKALLKIRQKRIREEIIGAVERLKDNLRPYVKKLSKKLKVPIQFYQFTAQYRIRIGDWRVLYDVDDKKRTVWILALRKRSKKTYK